MSSSLGLIRCCFKPLSYLPKGQATISASTREETGMSGGGENEFVSSEEAPELSGTVQVHHYVPLGLTRATRPSTIAPCPAWLLSSSRW